MLTLDFINVGYGDSILIRKFNSDSTFNMLVDCGDVKIDKPEHSKRISAKDFLVSQNIEKLDLLVNTHLHLDHVGGLLDIVNNIKVDNFWCNYLPDKKFWGQSLKPGEELKCGAKNLFTAYNIFSSSLDTLQKLSTNIKLIQTPITLDHFGHKDIKCQVFPEKDEIMSRQIKILDENLRYGAQNKLLNELDSFINNTSLRIKMKFNEWTILLPGDVYADCWSKYNLPSCDILKMPHHGHDDSFNSKLGEMLQPKYTVISVSNDRKDNCPSNNIVELLENYCDDISYTDAVVMKNQSAQYHNSVRFEINEKITKTYIDV